MKYTSILKTLPSEALSFQCLFLGRVYIAGSRAVVMECQFGPRRKGGLGKKVGEPETSGEYRQTCPAR